jgi:hypothetical protein
LNMSIPKLMLKFDSQRHGVASGGKF